MFCLHSERGLTLKGKIFAVLRSKVFHIMVDTFSDGLGPKESKQEVTKVFFPRKTW